MTLGIRSLTRSREKLKSLYLYYHSIFGDLTWQDGDLRWWAPPDYEVHDSLIALSFKITWSTKFNMRGFHAVCYFTLWWRGLARSRDKLKSFTTTYLYYHKIYDPKIRQDRDLHWLLFTHKAKWPYNHVVLWDHATN